MTPFCYFSILGGLLSTTRCCLLDETRQTTIKVAPSRDAGSLPKRQYNQTDNPYLRRSAAEKPPTFNQSINDASLSRWTKLQQIKVSHSCDTGALHQGAGAASQPLQGSAAETPPTHRTGSLLAALLGTSVWLPFWNELERSTNQKPRTAQCCAGASPQAAGPARQPLEVNCGDATDLYSLSRGNSFFRSACQFPADALCNHFSLAANLTDLVWSFSPENNGNSASALFPGRLLAGPAIFTANSTARCAAGSSVFGHEWCFHHSLDRPPSSRKFCRRSAPSELLSPESLDTSNSAFFFSRSNLGVRNGLSFST